MIEGVNKSNVNSTIEESDQDNTSFTKDLNIDNTVKKDARNTTKFILIFTGVGTIAIIIFFHFFIKISSSKDEGVVSNEENRVVSNGNQGEWVTYETPRIKIAYPIKYKVSSCSDLAKTSPGYWEDVYSGKITEAQLDEKLKTELKIENESTVILKYADKENEVWVAINVSKREKNAQGATIAGEGSCSYTSDSGRWVGNGNTIRSYNLYIKGIGDASVFDWLENKNVVYGAIDEKNILSFSPNDGVFSCTQDTTRCVSLRFRVSSQELYKKETDNITGILNSIEVKDF